MTARVITDPSALGWVLDPDTGRWEWSGSGDGGGSGGGGAWEVLERVEIGGAEMYEFDEFPDTHERFRVVWEFVGGGGFAANHAPYGYVKLDGSTDVFTGVYDWRVFLPTQKPNQRYDYFPLADWTNSGNPYGAGVIEFLTAGRGFQHANLVYHQISLAANAQQHSTNATVQVASSQRITGFRVLFKYCESGYFCVMGLKRD